MSNDPSEAKIPVPQLKVVLSGRAASVHTTPRNPPLFETSLPSKLDMGNVYLNGIHVLKQFTMTSITSTAIRVKMRSNLGVQVQFQSSNENLMDESCNVNQVFNTVNVIDEVNLKSMETQQIVLAFLPARSDEPGFDNYAFREVSGLLILEAQRCEAVTEVSTNSRFNAGKSSSLASLAAHVLLHPTSSMAGIYRTRVGSDVSLEDTPQSSGTIPKPEYVSTIKLRARVCQSMLATSAQTGILFEDCTVGTMAVRDFAVWNKSEIELQWAPNLSDAPKCLLFENEDGEGLFPMIQAYSQCRMRVTFRPEHHRDIFYDLMLENLNDPLNCECVRIQCTVAKDTGDALVLVSGSQLDFGDICAGQWKFATLTLRNATENLLDVQLTGNCTFEDDRPSNDEIERRPPPHRTTEEVTIAAQAERYVIVGYNPERSAKNVYEAEKFNRTQFKIIVRYHKECKTVLCKARVCTSFIQVVPTVVSFGETDVGRLKSLPIAVRNLAEVTAHVEVNFSSKVLKCNMTRFQILPNHSIELRIDICPRKVNFDYRKQITIVNVLNKNDNQIVEVHAKNIDEQRITWHSLFYQILTPKSTNFLDFGCVVGRFLSIAPFTLQNMTMKPITLCLSTNEHVFLYRRETSMNPLKVREDLENLAERRIIVNSETISPANTADYLDLALPHKIVPASPVKEAESTLVLDDLIKVLDDLNFADMRVPFDQKFVRLAQSVRKVLEGYIANGDLVLVQNVTIEPQSSMQILAVLDAPDTVERQRKFDTKIYLALTNFDVSLLPTPGELPIRAFLTRCTLCPSTMEIGQRNINFGVIELLETVKNIIILRNTSDAILLYSVKRSGSIASGDIDIKNRLGAVPPHGSREIALTFRPSLAGPFYEKLIVQNVQNPENQHVISLKANVHKSAFSIGSQGLDFGICLDKSMPKIITVHNCTKTSKPFTIKADDEHLSFEFCVISSEYVEYLEEEVEEQLETLDQKLKIAERKGSKDKANKIRASIKRLRGSSGSFVTTTPEDTASATSAPTDCKMNMLMITIEPQHVKKIAVTVYSKRTCTQETECHGFIKVTQQRDPETCKQIEYNCTLAIKPKKPVPPPVAEDPYVIENTPLDCGRVSLGQNTRLNLIIVNNSTHETLVTCDSDEIYMNESVLECNRNLITAMFVPKNSGKQEIDFSIIIGSLNLPAKVQYFGTYSDGILFSMSTRIITEINMGYCYKSDTKQLELHSQFPEPVRVTVCSTLLSQVMLYADELCSRALCEFDLMPMEVLKVYISVQPHLPSIVNRRGQSFYESRSLVGSFKFTVFNTIEEVCWQNLKFDGIVGISSFCLSTKQIDLLPQTKICPVSASFLVSNLSDRMPLECKITCSSCILTQKIIILQGTDSSTVNITVYPKIFGWFTGNIVVSNLNCPEQIAKIAVTLFVDPQIIKCKSFNELPLIYGGHFTIYFNEDIQYGQCTNAEPILFETKEPTSVQIAGQKTDIITIKDKKLYKLNTKMFYPKFDDNQKLSLRLGKLVECTQLLFVTRTQVLKVIKVYYLACVSLFTAEQSLRVRVRLGDLVIIGVVVQNLSECSLECICESDIFKNVSLLRAAPLESVVWKFSADTCKLKNKTCSIVLVNTNNPTNEVHINVELELTKLVLHLSDGDYSNHQIIMPPIKVPDFKRNFIDCWFVLTNPGPLEVNCSVSVEYHELVVNLVEISVLSRFSNALIDTLSLPANGSIELKLRAQVQECAKFTAQSPPCLVAEEVQLGMFVVENLDGKMCVPLFGKLIENQCFYIDSLALELRVNELAEIKIKNLSPVHSLSIATSLEMLHDEVGNICFPELLTIPPLDIIKVPVMLACAEDTEPGEVMMLHFYDCDSIALEQKTVIIRLVEGEVIGKEPNENVIVIKGCAKNGVYSLDFGHNDLNAHCFRKISLEAMVRCSYKISFIPPDARLWMSVSKTEGVIDPETQKSQAITISCSTASRGTCLGYLSIENVDYPADYKLVRVTLDVVAPHVVKKQKAFDIECNSTGQIVCNAFVGQTKKSNFTIINNESVGLEFYLKSTLPLTKSIFVNANSRRQVSVMFTPETDGILESEIHISCKLVKDHQECIKFTAHCYFPTISVNTDRIPFTIPNPHFIVRNLSTSNIRILIINDSTMFRVVDEDVQEIFMVVPKGECCTVNLVMLEKTKLEEHLTVYNEARPFEHHHICLGGFVVKTLYSCLEVRTAMLLQLFASNPHLALAHLDGMMPFRVQYILDQLDYADLHEKLSCVQINQLSSLLFSPLTDSVTVDAMPADTLQMWKMCLSYFLSRFSSPLKVCLSYNIKNE